MGRGGGPETLTFTIQDTFDSLDDEDKKSIQDSLDELFKDSGHGAVESIQFESGSIKITATTTENGNLGKLKELITKKGEVKTLGDKMYFVSEVNNQKLQYEDIVVLLVDDNGTLKLLYFNVTGDYTIEFDTTISTVNTQADRLHQLALNYFINKNGYNVSDIKSIALGKDIERIVTHIMSAELTMENIPLFENYTSLESITFNDKISSIQLDVGNVGDDRLFTNCPLLRSLNIPSSLYDYMNGGEGSKIIPSNLYDSMNGGEGIVLQNTNDLELLKVNTNSTDREININLLYNTKNIDYKVVNSGNVDSLQTYLIKLQSEESGTINLNGEEITSIDYTVIKIDLFNTEDGSLVLEDDDDHPGYKNILLKKINLNISTDVSGLDEREIKYGIDDLLESIRQFGSDSGSVFGSDFGIAETINKVENSTSNVSVITSKAGSFNKLVHYDKNNSNYKITINGTDYDFKLYPSILQ